MNDDDKRAERIRHELCEICPEKDNCLYGCPELSQICHNKIKKYLEKIKKEGNI